MSNNLFDDDYDPLAPVTMDDPDDADDRLGDDDLLAPPAPDLGDEDEDDDEALGEAGDGGFAGIDGIVRIWFDETGRLSKVRVSPVWFKKLPPGRTLEQAFQQAFRISSLEITQDPDREYVDYGELDFGELPPFSTETMNAYLALMADHKKRWDEVIAKAEATPRPKPPRAQGKSNGVIVTLDEFGHPVEIQFDQDWLDEAQVGSICTNVLAATQRAYEKYTPVTNENLTELERFRMEHDVLTAGFHALLNPKGR